MLENGQTSNNQRLLAFEQAAMTLRRPAIPMAIQRKRVSKNFHSDFQQSLCRLAPSTKLNIGFVFLRLLRAVKNSGYNTHNGCCEATFCAKVLAWVPHNNGRDRVCASFFQMKRSIVIDLPSRRGTGGTCPRPGNLLVLRGELAIRVFRMIGIRIGMKTDVCGK